MGKSVQRSHPSGPKPLPAVETPLRGRPARPPGLTKEATAHFDSVVSMMDQAGTLSMLDTDMLYMYIDAWSRYRTAKNHCRAQGLVVEGLHGPKKNPWYEVMIQAAQSIRIYADRLGLSPVARTKLRIETTDLDPTGKWALFGAADPAG